MASLVVLKLVAVTMSYVKMRTKTGEVLSACDFPHVHVDQGLQLALERVGSITSRFFRV